MAFEDATTAVEKILQDRQDALYKGDPIPWSTKGASSYTECVTKRFDRSKENQEWSKSRDERKVFKGGMSEQQMMATQLKVGWLAAMERDLRTQFMSGATGGRTSQDQTRYSLMSTLSAKLMLGRFVQLIKRRMEVKPKSSISA